MLVKFQHTVFYDILSTSNIKKIVNNKITCYCCGEQFTISSEFSLHIHNTIIIFETYVLQLFFREIDISTILYTSYQMHSCFLANHKRNLRIKTPSSIFAYNNFIHIRCGKYFFNYSDI